MSLVRHGLLARHTVPVNQRLLSGVVIFYHQTLVYPFV